MMDIFFSVLKYAIFSILVLVAADRFEIRGNTITHYVRQTLSHAQRFAQGTPDERIYKKKLANGEYATAVEDDSDLDISEENSGNLTEDSDESDSNQARQTPKVKKAQSERKKLQSLIQRLGGA